MKNKSPNKKIAFEKLFNHRYYSKKQNGLSIVEFAIILPLFLLLVFGIIEFGVMMFDKTMLTNASRNAARMATLQTLDQVTKKRYTTQKIENGTAQFPLDDTDPALFKPIGEWIETYCKKHLVSFGLGNSFTFANNVDISHSDLNGNSYVDAGENITVKIEYEFGYLILSNILNGIKLNAVAVMRAE